MENTEEINHRVKQLDDIFQLLTYQLRLEVSHVTESYRETIERIIPVAEQFISDHQLQYPIANSTQVLSEMGYYIKAQAPNNLSGFT